MSKPTASDMPSNNHSKEFPVHWEPPERHRDLTLISTIKILSPSFWRCHEVVRSKFWGSNPLPGRAEVAFKASWVMASFDCTASHWQKLSNSQFGGQLSESWEIEETESKTKFKANWLYHHIIPYIAYHPPPWVAWQVFPAEAHGTPALLPPHSKTATCMDLKSVRLIVVLVLQFIQLILDLAELQREAGIAYAGNGKKLQWFEWLQPPSICDSIRPLACHQYQNVPPSSPIFAFGIICQQRSPHEPSEQLFFWQWTLHQGLLPANCSTVVSMILLKCVGLL